MPARGCAENIPFDSRIAPNSYSLNVNAIMIEKKKTMNFVKFIMKCVIVVQYGNEFGELILDRMCMDLTDYELVYFSISRFFIFLVFIIIAFVAGSTNRE